MKLTYLETENFKVLKGVRRFEFPEGIIGITGSNGRGKSTIPNAIAWALYGTDSLKTAKADIVTWGTKSASARLIFETSDGEEWDICRTLNNAELYHGTMLSATGLDAVNAEIQRILSLDRVGFLTSVYARQEELAGIMSLTPANRIKTVMRLLRIEQLNAAIEDVRAKARDSKLKLDYMRNSMVDVPAVEEEILHVQQEIEAISSEVEEQQERLLELEKEGKSLEAKHSLLVPKLAEFQAYQEKYRQAQIDVARAESEMRNAQREAERPVPPDPGNGPAELVGEVQLSRAMTKLNLLMNEISATEEEIRNLEFSSFCVACGRPYDDAEQKKHHITSLSSQLIKLKAQLPVLENSYEVTKRIYNESVEWKAAHEKYFEAVNNQRSAQGRFERAATTYATAKQRQDAIEPVPDVSGALRALSADRLESTVAAGQIRESLATLAERKRSLHLAIDRLNKELQASLDRQWQVSHLEKDVTVIETVAAELVKLKTEMTAQVIPAIESRASQLITEFTDSRYNEISLTPDYDIRFRNDLGEYKSFENLSGGEKDVFSLALRLAISDLRASDIGLLMLDEVMESLDADRQESTWGAIERLTGRYNQIFLITHVQAFKDRATTVINV